MQTKIKEAQEKLCDKISNKGWLAKLRFFLKSSDFEDLLLSLRIEVEENRRFTPPLCDIFRCFELTPYEECDVVFVYPEPWPNPILNDGLAISTKDIKNTYSYYSFIAEIERDLNSCSVTEGDLTKVARQGVLLLNSSLTTQIQNPGRHRDIWHEFMNYFYDMMNRKEGMIWVFFGNNEYFDRIDNNTHTKFRVPSLPESKIQVWDSGNVFSKVNKELEIRGKINIIW